jgi:hypothetical protein
MKSTKVIWIVVIVCATLLLVPAVAGALRAHEEGFFIAGAQVPAAEETEVRLQAIEYDPAVSASYPALGTLGSPSERSF